ncbi:MAG: SET domain-containing protein-lysine N-methyltransferase [Nitrososphaerota archaeon]|nr:SET domain-containing protein-lysine N-methyltransferase [Nitrososphaerota archaeon]
MKSNGWRTVNRPREKGARRNLTVQGVGRKGRGVVTIGPIKAGTLVVGYYGRPKWIWEIPERDWEFCVQVGHDRYVVPRRGSFGRYVNHSCDPNCVIRGAGRVVARRDIEKGEEITFDYSTNVGWGPYRMKCMCGARNCRKTIRSYPHLPASLKRKYGRNVSAFLMEESAGLRRGSRVRWGGPPRTMRDTRPG